MTIYGWPILWLGAFGVGELVSFCRDIRPLRTLSQSGLYLLVVALLAVLAGVLSWRHWVGSWSSWPLVVVAAVLGVALAFPTLAADVAIARRARSWLERRRPRPASSAPPRRTVARPVSLGELTKAAPVTSRAPRPQAPSVLVQVAIGVAEEVVFRGGLLAFALSSGPWAPLLVVLGSAVFLLNHLDYGPHQVVAKVPLLAACLAMTLVTGSIFGAAALHGTFNLVMTTRMRERSRS